VGTVEGYFSDLDGGGGGLVGGGVVVGDRVRWEVGRCCMVEGPGGRGWYVKGEVHFVCGGVPLVTSLVYLGWLGFVGMGQRVGRVLVSSSHLLSFIAPESFSSGYLCTRDVFQYTLYTQYILESRAHTYGNGEIVEKERAS
jgi:hypothetical protein